MKKIYEHTQSSENKYYWEKVDYQTAMATEKYISTKRMLKTWTAHEIVINNVYTVHSIFFYLPIVAMYSVEYNVQNILAHSKTQSVYSSAFVHSSAAQLNDERKMLYIFFLFFFCFFYYTMYEEGEQANGNVRKNKIK